MKTSANLTPKRGQVAGEIVGLRHYATDEPIVSMAPTRRRVWSKPIRDALEKAARPIGTSSPENLRYSGTMWPMVEYTGMWHA